MNNEQTLFQAIQAANIEYDNHESDLYFPVTNETIEILRRFPDCQRTAERFTNQISGDRWFDVPFAYDPFWERKERLIARLREMKEVSAQR